MDPSTVIPLRELPLHYRVAEARPKRCLGHRSHKDNSHVDCKRGPATPNARKCERCQMMDGIFASNVHQAHRQDRDQLDRRFASNLERPHRLYLAAFRDGSVKVGVTASARGDDRLVEQGAWMARFVASFESGFDVRDVEDQVSAQLDVAQSVPMSRKLRGLTTPTDDDRLEAALSRLAREVDPLLRSSGVDHERSEELWHFVEANHPTWQNAIAYPLSLASGRHDLEIISACGQAVALRSGQVSDIFVADLSSMFGTMIEPGDFGSDELRIQDTLF